MAVNQTLSFSLSGLALGTTPPVVETFFILTQEGDFMLTEEGDRMLQEQA